MFAGRCVLRVVFVCTLSSWVIVALCCMWYLQEEPTREKPCARIPYWFGGVNGGGRTIGRKNVDIRLKASSVSRTHATIRVQKSPFHRASRGTVPTVEDSSAYGTFLKYPQGHAANRASHRDGHHDRLNKETPVEICEGALLAFGAPSPWWRVGWKSILVLPHSLDERQLARLQEVVASSGLAVAEQSTKSLADITHVVTPVCRTSSMTFLRAVIDGKQIVTPGWTNALEAMVSEACKHASTATTEEESLAATSIADEEAYRPPYSEEDIDAFGNVAIADAHDRSRDRSVIFRGIIFIFASDDRFGRWNSVLRSCGATCSVGAANLPDGSRVLHVSSIHMENSRAGVATPSCGETDLIRAILTGDAAPIQEASFGTPAVEPVPIADVATPAPSDSDAETADNEPVETDPVSSSRVHAGRRKRPRRPSGSVVSAEDVAEVLNAPVVKGAVDMSGDPLTKEQICVSGLERSGDDCGPGRDGMVPPSVSDRPIDGDNGLGDEEARNGDNCEAGGDDINNIVYFDVPEDANKRSVFESPIEDGANVKMFQKQSVPRTASGKGILLEKVRDAELELTPRASDRRGETEDNGSADVNEDCEPDLFANRGKRSMRSTGAFVEESGDEDGDDVAAQRMLVPAKRRRRR